MEIWKDIPRYEKLYEASDQGRIRNARTKRILKPKIHTDIRGYHHGRKDASVYLSKSGKDTYYGVPRLIATTFCGDNIETPLTVNHKDGDTLNNRADNLEWVSRSDNVRYGFEHHQFDRNLKPVTLISAEGKEITFHSQCDACRFLGRSFNYISHRIKANKQDAFDKAGHKYIIRSRCIYSNRYWS